MPSRLLTGVLAFAISALPASALAADDLGQELARLNEQMLRGYVLEHDVSAYEAHAHPDYKLIYAPGIIENLPMVLEGVELVDLTRFDMETLAVDVVGDAALIITGIQAEGTVAGRTFPPRVTMMHFWVRENGAWKLLGESMTPMVVPPEEFERMNAMALPPE